ncbi:MAG: cation:proton antiporter, partial [Cyanobacteria bacterium REEB65]|nr:cation:proton antiporter [Cyanobacteria bacterium REEB65]
MSERFRGLAHRVPYPVVMLLIGLVAYWLPWLHPPALAPDVFLIGLLPPLLFEAAWNLRIPTLQSLWFPVLWLILPGVTLAILIIGGIARVALGFPWPAALLLGALLSPTDPTAVVAIFRSLRVPRNFETLIEAESLFNDGTGFVAFKVLLGGALGASLSFGHILGSSLWL